MSGPPRDDGRERADRMRELFRRGAPGAISASDVYLLLDDFAASLAREEAERERADTYEQCDCVPLVFSSRSCPKCGRRGVAQDSLLVEHDKLRERAERAEAKLCAVAEREKFGQMTHWCRSQDCGTVSFGAGYKGKCPSCKQEGEPISLSAREPGKAS